MCPEVLPDDELSLVHDESVHVAEVEIEEIIVRSIHEIIIENYIDEFEIYIR